MHSALGERLLRAGISPARVARYSDELEAHLADLTDQLVAAGLTQAEARAAALVRLGDPETLVAAMLAEPGLRSLPSRRPALVWLALPLLLQLGIVALLAVLLVAAGRQGLAPPAPAIVDPLLLLAPLGIAWGIATSALRRRTAIGWPLAGVLATLLAAATLDLGIGADAVAVSLNSPAPELLALYALAAVVPFLLLYRHLRVR